MYFTPFSKIIAKEIQTVREPNVVYSVANILEHHLYFLRMFGHN